MQSFRINCECGSTIKNTPHDIKRHKVTLAHLRNTLTPDELSKYQFKELKVKELPTKPVALTADQKRLQELSDRRTTLMKNRLELVDELNYYKYCDKVPKDIAKIKVIEIQNKIQALNKEYTKAYTSASYDCPCGGKYKMHDRATHLRSAKHLIFINSNK